jgi:hypothetical protein
MNYFAFVISVLMGIGSLAFVYADAGYDLLVRGLLLFGAFWLYAGWRRWTWVASVGILWLVALSGYGLWIALSTGWLIAGALGGLLAWDLSDFMRRIDYAHAAEDTPGMQRRHLARLTIVAVIGLLFASIAMLVREEFTLEWTLLLTLVGVLGLTQLVAWLRRG